MIHWFETHEKLHENYMINRVNHTKNLEVKPERMVLVYMISRVDRPFIVRYFYARNRVKIHDFLLH